jgi:beta-galactosidase
MQKLLTILACGISLMASDIIVKTSECSVDTTLNNIKSILKEKDLSVFAVIDHHKNAQDVEMKLNESKIIIFGNAKLGTILMQQDIKAGLDLPLRIFVYKDNDGKVKMAYRNGAWLANQHVLNAEEKIEQVTKGMEDITTKAGQCIKD